MRVSFYTDNGIRDDKTFEALCNLLLSDAEFSFDAFTSFHLSDWDIRYLRKEMPDEKVIQLVIGLIKHAYAGTLHLEVLAEILNCLKTDEFLNDEDLCEIIKAHYVREGACAPGMNIQFDVNLLSFCQRASKMTDTFREIIQTYHKKKALNIPKPVTDDQIFEFLKWSQLKRAKLWIDRNDVTPEFVSKVNEAGITMSTRSHQFWRAWRHYIKKVTTYGKNAKTYLRIIKEYRPEEQREYLSNIDLTKLDDDARAEYIRLTSKIML